MALKIKVNHYIQEWHWKIVRKDIQEWHWMQGRTLIQEWHWMYKKISGMTLKNIEKNCWGLQGRNKASRNSTGRNKRNKISRNNTGDHKRQTHPRIAFGWKTEIGKDICFDRRQVSWTLTTRWDVNNNKTSGNANEHEVHFELFLIWNCMIWMINACNANDRDNWDWLSGEKGQDRKLKTPL